MASTFTPARWVRGSRFAVLGEVGEPGAGALGGDVGEFAVVPIEGDEGNGGGGTGGGERAIDKIERGARVACDGVERDGVDRNRGPGDDALDGGGDLAAGHGEVRTESPGDLGEDENGEMQRIGGRLLDQVDGFGRLRGVVGEQVAQHDVGIKERGFCHRGLRGIGRRIVRRCGSAGGERRMQACRRGWWRR